MIMARAINHAPASQATVQHHYPPHLPIYHPHWCPSLLRRVLIFNPLEDSSTPELSGHKHRPQHNLHWTCSVTVLHCLIPPLFIEENFFFCTFSIITNVLPFLHSICTLSLRTTTDSIAVTWYDCDSYQHPANINFLVLYLYFASGWKDSLTL